MNLISNIALEKSTWPLSLFLGTRFQNNKLFSVMRETLAHGSVAGANFKIKKTIDKLKKRFNSIEMSRVVRK